MLTAANIDLVINGRRMTMTPGEAAMEAAEISRCMDRLEGQKLAEALRLGAFLRQVRAHFVHGSWEPWLAQTHIHKSRARRAMELAAQLADADGRPDADKLLAHGLTPTGTGRLDSHGNLLDGISLRRAEIAAGVRKAVPASVEEVEEVEDDPQYASDAELALYLEDDGGQPEEAMESAVLVGAKDVKPGDVVLHGPEHGPERGPVIAGAVAGRIGPGSITRPEPRVMAQLAAARRSDVAGQMTLAPLFDEVYIDVQKQDQAGRGERARAIVAEGLADIRRRLAELGEAA